MAGNNARPRKHELTGRQLQILKLAALCVSVKESALELEISEKTVSYHMEKLKRNLGLWSRDELIRYALESGIIKAGERFVSAKPKTKTADAPRTLATGTLVDALVTAAGGCAVKAADGDPVSVDGLVKIVDSLVNVARLQMQLEDRRLSVTWLNGSMKKIEDERRATEN